TAKVLHAQNSDQITTDYCHYYRGISFFKKKMYQEAESELLHTSKNPELSGKVNAQLGSVALEQSNFTKALRYYTKAEKQVTTDLGINISNLKHNIGLCYLHLEKYPESENYLTQSVSLFEKKKDTLELVGAYGDIATLYYEQYKDDVAIPYFLKAYQLAKSMNDFELKQLTSKNMAIVEENRKDYPKSIQYYKEYMKWSDSVNDQHKIYAVAQAEKKIAVEKKDKEVALLKADNDVKAAQRNTYLYSALILLVMFGVSFYLYRQKVQRNKIINAQKENLDALNATKDKLFSIVSHDLRSSVNAIKTSNKKLVTTLETEDLSEVNTLLQSNSAIVNGTYNLLDNLLNWALLQTQQTRFEITKLRLTSIVEHVSYNYKALLADKALTFENTVSKKVIVYADQESLKIILRNLIDNAIKFSNPEGKITVYVAHNDADFCQFIIEDTGFGMSETTRLELLKDTSLLAKKEHEDSIGTGLGMQLCKSMIAKNHGKLFIESELGKGTKMIVSLPNTLTS
ncbi:MAG: tetratricopeptide repeat-containing sensor histidine kinase, partial [Bacteroidota bacterium]